MEITFLPYIHYLSFLICIFLIGYIVYSNIKSLLSIITILFIACFALWSLGKIFIHNPDTTIEGVKIWYNVVSIGWLSFSYFFLLFSILYSNPAKFYKYKWLLLALSIFPIVFVFEKYQGALMASYIRAPYGWNFVWKEGFWTYLFYIYYITFVVSSIGILYFFGKKTKLNVRKKQVKIINTTAVIALSCGSLTDIVLNNMGFDLVPSLANAFSMIWVIGVAFVIIKYNFLSITPKSAANNIISTMSDGLILVNQGGGITYVNEKILELTGFGAKELLNKNINFLFKSSSLAKDLVKRSKNNKDFRNYEIILKTKGRKRNITVVFSNSKLNDEEGGLVGFVCIIKDITEIRKTEEKLRQRNKELKENMEKIEESKERMAKFVRDLEREKKKSEKEKNKTSSIIDSFNDPIIFIDNKGRIQLFNKAAKENLGFEESVLNKKVKKDNNYSINNFKRFIKKDFEIKEKGGGGQESFEEMLLQPKEGGKEKFYKIITVEVQSGDGNSYGYMKVFNNLTREKEIDKIKTHFITIAAHQLRTPLSAIKWSLKMILDKDAGKLHEEQEEVLSKTYESNERIIRLVNDLLNVSRIEEGKFNYEFKKQELGKVVDEVVEREASLISGKRLDIKVNKPKGMPKVYIDRDKILLALENILANAIKYSEENKSIKVNLDKEEDFIRVGVEDNGMGIPNEDLVSIFDKFYRAENVKKTDIKGSGLGLYIVKNIIDKHGGEVDIDSEVGKGTKVSFTVPTKKNKVY